MWKPDFALEEFRTFFLKDYHAKYLEGKVRNYLGDVDAIIEMGEDPSTN
jgi:hypothetical protein